MTLNDLCKKIRERLPGGSRFRAVLETWYLYRNNRDIPFYRIQFILNIKSYFRLIPLLPLNCRIAEPCPLVLYHVTCKAHCPSIFAEGLHNEKSSLVFLTDSYKVVSYFLQARQDPVVLRIDAKRMHDEGYSFFNQTADNAIYLTNHVPAQYISFDNIST